MSSIPLTKMKVLQPNAPGDNDNLKKGVLSMAYNYQQHALISCGQDRRLTFWDMN